MLKKVDERDEVKNTRHKSFVGTPLYVAPEMLEFNESGLYTDLWALGCIIYQFLTGATPFQGRNQNEVFQNILENKIVYPNYMDKDGVDLIKKLLDYNPENRLGYQNMQKLKDH